MHEQINRKHKGYMYAALSQRVGFPGMIVCSMPSLYPCNLLP